MKKYLRMCFCLIIVSMLLSGCDKLNPFATPEIRRPDSDESDKLNEEMERVKDNIDNAEKKADEFGQAFEKKTKDIYYNALEKYTQGSSENKGKGITGFLGDFYGTYEKVKIGSPAIVIVSIIFGTLGAVFSKHNKGSRRFFIIAFIFIIPILVLLIVFGVGILNSLFLY